MTSLPNFFVIGAARSGTTSLHHYLGTHPDIYMCPIKEPNFFAAVDGDLGITGRGAAWLNANSVIDADAYRQLFLAADGHRAIGEVSPCYLTTPGTAARIHSAVPEARLIAVLRHPADRAFAGFVSGRRDGVEPFADFRQAIADEPRRIAEKWSYGQFLTVGRYHQHLQEYLRYFHRDQLRVYLHEDLHHDSASVLANIFSFLRVDPNHVVDTNHRHNVSGEIGNPVLAWVWRNSFQLRTGLRPLLPRRWRDQGFAWINRGNTKPQFDPQLRAELTEYWREDIERLAEFLDRDLSGWLRNE